ncbi:MAG TPA: hypothetical protein VFU41_08660, partial [Gemmatimonadales bacterium]|nr:hypothetical protein [Gemmatimonadales bacterium]
FLPKRGLRGRRDMQYVGGERSPTSERSRGGLLFFFARGEAGPMAGTEERLLSLTEAAAACDVSWYVLRTALLRTELRARRVGGRWVVSLAEVRRWAEQDLKDGVAKLATLHGARGTLGAHSAAGGD